MDPTPVSAVVVRRDPLFSEEERLAVAGFAGYRGLTREAYTPTRGSSSPSAPSSGSGCSR